LITGKIYPDAWRLVYQTLVCWWAQICSNKTKTKQNLLYLHRNTVWRNFQNVVSLSTIVTNASFVENLGIFFDRTLCMPKQASAITKSCYFQIRNIERNRSYTSEDACKTLVCSLVTSRLDYGNALLLISNIISKLTRSKKHDHITPVLLSLHWLPMQYRIQYKLLVCTFIALHGQTPIYLKELISFYQP
jgi:hypothetical protein